MAIDTLTQKIVLDERGYADGMKTVERVTRETTAKVRAEFRRTRTAAQQIGVSSRDVNQTANAISQLGSAAGGAAGELGALVSQVSAGFLTGGAIGAGISLATMAIGKITSAMREAREETERLAREAEKELAAAMAESKEKIDSANQSLEEQKQLLADIHRALAEGIDPSEATAARVAAESEAAAADAAATLQELRDGKAELERTLRDVRAERARLSSPDIPEEQRTPEIFQGLRDQADELQASIDALAPEIRKAERAADEAASAEMARVAARNAATAQLLLTEQRRHDARMESLRVERRVSDLVAAGENASIARLLAELELLDRREEKVRAELAANPINGRAQRDLLEITNRRTEATAQLAQARREADRDEEARLAAKAAREQAEAERRAADEAMRRAGVLRQLALVDETLRIQREQGVSAAEARGLAEIAMLERQIEATEDLTEKERLRFDLETLRRQHAQTREAQELAGLERLAVQADAERKRTADMIAARDQLTEATKRGVPVEQVRAEHALRAAKTEVERVRAMEDSAEKADLLAIALERVAQAEITLAGVTPVVITQAQAMRDAFLETGEAIRDALIDTISEAIGQLAMYSQHTAKIEEATQRATEAQLAFGEASEKSASASQSSAEFTMAAVAAQTQAVLAGIAEEAAAKALFNVAEGVALSLTPGMQGAAATKFAAAAMFGLLAGGAVAAGAGIGAGRGMTREEAAQIDRADADRARAEHDRRAGEDRDGGLTVVVQTSQVYGTETDVNRAVREGVENAGWYD